MCHAPKEFQSVEQLFKIASPAICLQNWTVIISFLFPLAATKWVQYLHIPTSIQYIHSFYTFAHQYTLSPQFRKYDRMPTTANRSKYDFIHFSDCLSVRLSVFCWHLACSSSSLNVHSSLLLLLCYCLLIVIIILFFRVGYEVVRLCICLCVWCVSTYNTHVAPKMLPVCVVLCTVCTPNMKMPKTILINSFILYYCIHTRIWYANEDFDCLSFSICAYFRAGSLILSPAPGTGAIYFLISFSGQMY